MTVPHIFRPGGIVTSADINENFATLDAQTAALRTDIASTATGKGAALVGFSGFNGATTTKAVLDGLRSSVSVIEFGAVGDGSTDDRTAIQAAIDYAYANDMDVVFPADIPAYYKISLNLVCRPGVSMRGIGGKAKIKNMNTGGATLMDRSVFLMGNMLLNYTQLLTSYDCGTVGAGNSVTLTTIGDAANFAVGDQVVTLSTATSLSSGFTLNDYLHLNEVTGKAGAVLTLKYPIDVSYAGGIAKLSSVSTTAAPIVLPMYFIDNCTFENLDIEAPGGGMFSGYGGMYNVTVRDCIIDGQWGPYTNCAQYCTFTNNQWYFSSIMGDYSLNSIHSTTSGNRFTYKYDATIPTPVARYQFSEAARQCRFIDNSVNLNRLVVLAGNSVVAFGSAQRCVASGNTIVSDAAGSNLTLVTFAGRTAGLRCLRNTFSDNVAQFDRVRLFAYFVTLSSTTGLPIADTTNTDNRFERNLLTANTGDFAYSLRMDNCFSATIRGNRATFGALHFFDTASADNIIEDNYFPLGFGTNETSLNENYYQQNRLRNNSSLASLAKQRMALTSASAVNAPASTTTTVYGKSIGTNAQLRDEFNFEFYIKPTGAGATKPIAFNLRDNTTPADIALFSHPIPIASVGNLVVQTRVILRSVGVANASVAYTTIFDATLGATTSYATFFTRPLADREIIFNLIAALGVGVSLDFPQITAQFSNPYN